jgi:hypothetical protein
VRRAGLAVRCDVEATVRTEDMSNEDIVKMALAYAKADGPCPHCGRDPSTHLTLLEVHEQLGYGKAKCPECLLTDHKRTDA